MNLIGEVALNVSFILYLLFYLPQLVHNFKAHNIRQMSLGFHALLFISATADLYYGFGRIAQWQYPVVSVVMFSCLLVQHVQLCGCASLFKYGRLLLAGLTVCVMVMLLLLWITLQHALTHLMLFVMMGWVERIGYWLYSIPQIIKNIKNNSATAISPVFLLIAMLTAICDTISAWTFSWGPSSLYGAPVAIVLHVVLLWQWRSQQPQLSQTEQIIG